jgi:hypothetical protein
MDCRALRGLQVQPELLALWELYPTGLRRPLIRLARWCSALPARVNGSSYVAVAANTNQNPPTQTSFWQLIAQVGAMGALLESSALLV